MTVLEALSVGAVKSLSLSERRTVELEKEQNRTTRGGGSKLVIFIYVNRIHDIIIVNVEPAHSYSIHTRTRAHTPVIEQYSHDDS